MVGVVTILRIRREERHVRHLVVQSCKLLRECLVEMYGDKQLVRVDGEELVFVKGLSTKLDGNSCKQLSDELNEAIIHIERNGSGKLIFTDLSLKCMKIVKQIQKQSA